MPRPYSSRDPERKARMKRLIDAGEPIEVITRELGYANERSTRAMAHRWNVDDLLPDSRSPRWRELCPWVWTD
jgi:hypothetical protein